MKLCVLMMALATLLVPVQSSAVPVSLWSAEGNANDVVDGNNGILKNGASFAPGKVGQAFSLDGVNDYVLVPNSANLNFGTGDFSIEAWVKTSFRGGSANDFILARISVGTDIQYAFIYKASLAGDGSAFFAIGSTAVEPGISIADGNWHLLDGVRQGTLLSFYIDGLLVGTANTPTLLNIVSTNNLTIGGRESAGNDPYFTGLIDEAAVYNYALSAAEIRQHAGIPAPSTLLLLMLGLAGLGRVAKRSARNRVSHIAV